MASLLRRKPKKSKEDQTTMGALVELVGIVVVALGLALGIQAFLVKPYRIPSESMLPTLVPGQRVLVNRIGHSFSKPSIGDIVVFHPPKDATSMTCGVEHPAQSPCPEPEKERSDTNFIKRIVAGPGDTLAIVNGHAVVNGKQAPEKFIKPCAPGNSECNFPKAITIPAGHYFMMGDNRGESDDSRYWGPVPDKWIIGGAFATYWPPKRWNIF